MGAAGCPFFLVPVFLGLEKTAHVYRRVAAPRLLHHTTSGWRPTLLKVEQCGWVCMRDVKEKRLHTAVCRRSPWAFLIVKTT